MPVLSATEQRALLAACGGTELDDRRDTAVIRLFLDTGMRLAELAGLCLDDLDLDPGVAVVLGKGRRPRACPFGARTSQALDRYLRSRERHRLAALPDTWLTPFGPMTGSAIAQMARPPTSAPGTPTGGSRPATVFDRWSLPCMGQPASWTGEARCSVLPTGAPSAPTPAARSGNPSGKVA